MRGEGTSRFFSFFSASRPEAPPTHLRNNVENTHTGAYHSWIALCVWVGVEGYRWSDIPSYG